MWPSDRPGGAGGLLRFPFPGRLRLPGSGGSRPSCLHAVAVAVANESGEWTEEGYCWAP